MALNQQSQLTMAHASSKQTTLFIKLATTVVGKIVLLKTVIWFWWSKGLELIPNIEGP